MEEKRRDFSRALIGTFAFVVACVAIGFAFGQYLYDGALRWPVIAAAALAYFELGFTTRWWGSILVCLAPVILFVPIGAPERAHEYTSAVNPIPLSLVWAICLVVLVPAWFAGLALGRRRAGRPVRPA